MGLGFTGLSVIGRVVRRTAHEIWVAGTSTRAGNCRRAVAEELEGRWLLAVWPAGPAFDITTYTTGYAEQSVAMDASGNFVVVWSRNSEDGVPHGITGRRYDASGIALGPEFLVNSFTSSGTGSASIAMDAVGDFIVTWGTGMLDGSDSVVVARRFDSSATPLGTEFVVNSYTTGYQRGSKIAMSAAGDFVIAWESVGQDGSDSGVYAQRFDSSGLRVGNEFQVNSFTPDAQTQIAVASSDSGAFVIAWESRIQDNGDWGVYARHFDSSGAPQGPDFRVNTYTTDEQRLPEAAMDSAGNFTIIWTSFGQDGSADGVYAQQYSSTGAPQGGEFRVNTSTSGYQWYPSISMQSDGDFIVSWDDNSTNDGIYARRYTSTGFALETELPVLINPTQSVYRSNVAINDAGAFVVAWNRSIAAEPGGIEAQVYRTVQGTEAATVSGRAWVDTDADGIQDAGEVSLEGVTVKLFGSGGFLSDITTTDPFGNYSFQVLPNELIYIAFAVPGGYVATRGNQGPSDELDSDIDGSGFTPVFSLASAGIVDETIDAGFYQPASLGGITFHDRNGNQSFDPLEEALGGVEVFIDFNEDGTRDAAEPFAITNSSGSYALANLVPGMLAVTVAARDDWAGFSFSLPVPMGANLLGVNVPLTTIVPDTMAVPVGPEFRVNAYTTNIQTNSMAAISATGDAVVVWQSEAQDGSGYGIYARRYASGMPLGSEFRVNTYTTGDQQNPVVALGPSGAFLIVWQSTAQDGSQNGIYAQRFDSHGSAQGPEFRVNTYTTSTQLSPAVAMDRDENAIVAWSSNQDGSLHGIYAQRYDFHGATLGSEFRVNVYTTGIQSSPAVAMDSDGDFVIAWTSNFQDGSYGGIFARIFNADAQPVTGEFLVNGVTIGLQVAPVIAMDPDGAFAVVWESAADFVAPPVVYARRYADTGVPLGSDFRIDMTTSSQRLPAATFHNGNGLIVAWNGTGASDPDGIYWQRFNAAGIRQGEPFRVNSYTTGSQSGAAIAMNATGDVLVAWTSLDGGYGGVYAQRYQIDPVPLGVSSQFIWQSNPQRIEFGFTVDVAPFITPTTLLLQNLDNLDLDLAGSIISVWGEDILTATYTFPSLPNGGALPNGRYRATFVPPNAPAAANQSFEFFFINGDANHDGQADVLDLVALANNWLLPSNFDYTNGDFNYDGFVDQKDLGILAVNWQASLATLAPPLPAQPTSPSPRPATRTPTRTTVAPVIQLVSDPVPTPAPARTATRTPVR